MLATALYFVIKCTHKCGHSQIHHRHTKELIAAVRKKKNSRRWWCEVWNKTSEHVRRKALARNESTIMMADGWWLMAAEFCRPMYHCLHVSIKWDRAKEDEKCVYLMPYWYPLIKQHECVCVRCDLLLQTIDTEVVIFVMFYFCYAHKRDEDKPLPKIIETTPWTSNKIERMKPTTTKKNEQSQTKMVYMRMRSWKKNHLVILMMMVMMMSERWRNETKRLNEIWIYKKIWWKRLINTSTIWNIR